MREIELKPDELLNLSNDIFTKGSHIAFKARGHSMYPYIQDGDVLDIDAVAASDLKIGEVVFFRSAAGGPTVHRLIGRRMSGGSMTLIMRGDAASSADAPVREEEVLGRVTRIQRREKTFDLDHDRPWTIPLRIKLFLIVRIVFPLSRSSRRIAAYLQMGFSNSR